MSFSFAVALGSFSFATALVSFSFAATPAAAQPGSLPPQPLAGPGSGVVALGGLAIARDGTGGVAYLAGPPGAEHVFVAPLVGGSFAPAIQVDAGLAAGASQPVLAAGNGGVLLCAFVSAGELYVTQAGSPGGPWSTPTPVYAGAQNPSLSMSNFGKAYLAFTAAGDGGEDVRVDYFDSGSWSLVPAPLNVTPGDDAGTGAGAPDVAAAGDGLGIITWGEGGHIYARRVWATEASTVTAQLDPPSVDGQPVTATGSPEVAVGGDSSYADVVFRAEVGSGSTAQTRELLGRLIAEKTVTGAPVDGFGQLTGTSPSDSAGTGELSMNEYGRGFVAFADITSGAVIATPLGTNGTPGAPSVIGSAAPGLDSHPTPAPAGLISNLITWQQGTGGDDGAIVVRYAADGSHLGAPITLSDPTAGPAQAAAGLAAGGDSEGDAAVAWMQGPPDSPSLEVDQLLQPPGQPVPVGRLTYVGTAQPQLQWSPAREEWGSLTYTVTLDGAVIGQTLATAIGVPAPLVDGPHVWQVSATNLAGETSAGPPATVFVDTAPPVLRIGLSGRLRARRRLTLTVASLDAPAPEAGARASGISSVSVRWGDRSATATLAPGSRRLRHAYSRAGVYRVLVVAVDMAGNRTTIARYVHILR